LNNRTRAANKSTTDQELVTSEIEFLRAGMGKNDRSVERPTSIKEGALFLGHPDDGGQPVEGALDEQRLGRRRQHQAVDDGREPARETEQDLRKKKQIVSSKRVHDFFRFFIKTFT